MLYISKINRMILKKTQFDTSMLFLMDTQRTYKSKIWFFKYRIYFSRFTLSFSIERCRIIYTTKLFVWRHVDIYLVFKSRHAVCLFKVVGLNDSFDVCIHVDLRIPIDYSYTDMCLKYDIAS